MRRDDLYDKPVCFLVLINLPPKVIALFTRPHLMHDQAQVFSLGDDQRVNRDSFCIYWTGKKHKPSQICDTITVTFQTQFCR